MHLKYFAYGADMLEQWLTAAERVPGARYRSRGSVRGYRLGFDKPGLDGSGKCHIYKTTSVDDMVNGVVYEVPDDQVPALDRLGGLGAGYYHEHVPVQLPDGAVMPVLAFVTDVSTGGEKPAPFDWYLKLVIAGAEQHRLPKAYIETIRAVPTIAGPEPGKTPQRDAESALKGYTNND